MLIASTDAKRKFLKILFHLFCSLYILKGLTPIRHHVDNIYIDIAFLAFLIPYLIYEAVQLTKDDKIKGTPFFINRVLAAIIGCVSVILLLIFLN